MASPDSLVRNACDYAAARGRTQGPAAVTWFLG
jgi:hypothetical protein